MYISEHRQKRGREGLETLDIGRFLCLVVLLYS